VINELETFFNSTTLPDSIQLSKSENILNVKRFVASHIAFAKSLKPKNGEAYLNRLLTLKTILEK